MNGMKKIKLAALCFAFIGCSALEQSSDTSGYTHVIVTREHQITGCDFLLKDATDQIYEPLNLAEEHKEEGKPLYIKYHSEKDMATTCMKGKIITITDYLISP